MWQEVKQVPDEMVRVRMSRMVEEDWRFIWSLECSTMEKKMGLGFWFMLNF